MNARRTFSQTLATATLAWFAAGAFAQTAAPAPATAPGATPKVDVRQAKQEGRIEKGMATGQLTTTETKRLEAQQTHINKVEDKAKADGTVSKEEKARLAHLQHKANRDIKRQKHDRQGAASAPK